jgi:hypothetical protein
MTEETNVPTFDEMLTEAMVEVAGADAGDALDDAGDAGPEDDDAEEGDDESGELADAAADEEGGGYEEGDEDESDELGVDPDEDEAESAEPVGDGEPDELADLRDMVARQGDELRQLRDQAGVPQPPPQPQPQRVRGPDPRLIAAVEAIYQGGDVKENLKGFDSTIQRAAIQHATSENARQARYGLDPHAAYADRIAPFVANHVAQMVEERFRALEHVQTRRHVGEVVRGFDSVLRTGDDKHEVARILREDLPPNEHQTLEQRMRIAVELFVARRDSTKLAKAKGKVDSRKRDQEARKNARRAGGGRRRNKRGRPRPPEIGNNGDMAEFISWAQKNEDQLGDADFAGVE